MATRRFKINIGETDRDVVSEVGAAVNSDHVELTVELGGTIGGASRAPTRQEVLIGIRQLERHIQTCNWPPA